MWINNWALRRKIQQASLVISFRDKIAVCCFPVWLQKRRDRGAEVLPNGDATNRTEASSATEDISVPKDLDLIALPQLCFPGMMHPPRDIFNITVF